MSPIHAAVGAIVSLKLLIAYILLGYLPKIQIDEDKENIIAEQIETALFTMTPVSNTDEPHLRLLPNASKTVVCHLNTEANFTCQISIGQSILLLQTDDAVEAVTVTKSVKAVVACRVKPCGVNEFGQIEQFQIRQATRSLVVGASSLLAKDVWEKKMAQFVPTEHFQFAVSVYWNNFFHSLQKIQCPFEGEHDV